nr:leucine-rich repeat-containing protein 71-like [Megalopta genalis]XP_033323379.1 leucine-rich repeat-containing protein 71-like [Megalopta genalis]
MQRLPDSRINAFGVMQIAEMLTNIGCLRDLDLDMNPNAQENFHLLCQPAGNLLFLSLRHCKISDEGVKKIANELRYRDPPNDPKLISLSLSNNRVTCEGAAHLGSMLRTNRSLKSLSLLANRMCDDGAWAIIKELKITTLEHEEIVDLRRKRFEELTSPAEELVSKEFNNDSTEEKGRKNNKSRSVRSSSRRSKTCTIDAHALNRERVSLERDCISSDRGRIDQSSENRKHRPGSGINAKKESGR